MTRGREVIPMSDIVQIISTVGFPIVSFLLCGAALKYVYDKERTSLTETIKRVEELTLAVEKNSETLRDLVEWIKSDDTNV